MSKSKRWMWVMGFLAGLMMTACTPVGGSIDANGNPIPGKNTFEFSYQMSLTEAESTVDIQVEVKRSDEVYKVIPAE